jgi:tetratricopeptide (TPR) repeat protein
MSGPRTIGCLLIAGFSSAVLLAAPGQSPQGGPTKAAAPAAATSAPPAEFLLAEDFLAQGKEQEYIAWARRFLTQNASSPRSPRVALDLYIVGVKVEDSDLQTEALRRLVFDYAESPPTALVLKLLGDDETDFRRFLMSEFGRLSPSRDAARRFVAAAAAGAGNWGTGFLSDGEFLLAVGLAAEGGEVDHLSRFCRERLREWDEPLRSIAGTALDSSLPKVERISRLRSYENHSGARLCQQFLLGRLTRAERSAPPICLIEAEALLDARDFAAALAAVDRLAAAQPEPRAAYWRAVCLAATGKHREAAEVFSQLGAEYPQEMLGATARQLAATLLTADDNLDQHVQVVHRIVQALRKQNPTVIECRIHDVTAAARSDLYAGIDQGDGEQIHVFVQRNSQLVFGASLGKSARVYLPGETKIYEFQKCGAFLRPELRISREPSGQFTFSCSASISQERSALGAAMNEILQSHFLDSQEGLRQLVGRSRELGAFPCPVRRRDGQIVLPWVAPGLQTPNLEAFEFVVEAPGKLSLSEVSDKGRPSTIATLRYGPKGSFELTPPTWPDLPIETHAELDARMVLRIVDAALQVKP